MEKPSDVAGMVFIGPRCPGVRSMCPDVCQWVSKRRCADLTDVTLADQATNLIQADYANMAIRGNMAMQVTQPIGQLWNFASGPTWWPN